MGSPGSLGTIVPGYEAKIVDDQRNPVAQGETGTLMIKSDSVAVGYWNQHEATKKNFQGDWFYTGDMVYQSPDGILWYVGRNDDMLKVSGMWVSPIEVEEALSAHPWVQECAVVGTDKHSDVPTLIAYVVCSDDIKPDEGAERALKEFLRGHLPLFKCPQTFYFLQELPRSSVGKIQRYKLGPSRGEINR